MPPSRTGRRPNRSDSGPITNWPTPKPTRNIDSTICGRLAAVMWKADAMSGSAGSIMSIASGLSAMTDAITMTNSGKSIGRWPEAATALALVSDNERSFCWRHLMDFGALHNRHFGNGRPSAGGACGGLHSNDEEVCLVTRPKALFWWAACSIPYARNNSLIVFERRPCVGPDLEDRHAQEHDGTGADGRDRAAVARGRFRARCRDRQVRNPRRPGPNQQTAAPWRQGRGLRRRNSRSDARRPIAGG